MATKLKDYSRQWYCKLFAWLCIVGILCSMTWMAFRYLLTLTDDEFFPPDELLFSDTYTNSNVCDNCLMNIAYMLNRTQHISDQDYRDFCYEIYSRYDQGDGEVYDGYELDSEDPGSPVTIPAVTDTVLYKIGQSVQKTMPQEMYRDTDFHLYLKLYETAIQQEWDDKAQENADEQGHLRQLLESYSGEYLYYINCQNTNILTNIHVAEPAVTGHTTVDPTAANGVAIDYAGTIESLSAYVAYDAAREGMVLHAGRGDYTYGIDAHKDDIILVGMREEYLASREALWNQQRPMTIRFVSLFGCGMLLLLVLFLYLSMVTGRKPASEDVHLCVIDKICSECYVVIEISLLFVLALSLEAITDYTNPMTAAPMFVTLITLSGAITLTVLLSFIRSLKAHRFIRSFFCGRILLKLLHWAKRVLLSFFRWCKKTFFQVWNGGSMMARGMTIAILIPLLCAIWIPIPFVMAGMAYLVYRLVTQFQKIQEGLRQVKAGNPNYKIQDITDADLRAVAEDINTLSEGLDSAISAELRAERLKTELISNVSHDIKTPLTSIVTYVDLLKSELEKETPDQGRLVEYTEVLEQKAERLRVLTSDLFEAAKASSGAIPVCLERVEVQSLLKQGLAEFDTKLQAAGLDVRVQIPEKPIYVQADGRLVWRILENMLSNVCKYALQGSRVYINVEKQEYTRICLTVKNISAYELNIPSNELMERFKRGDESRNSEGSGLGLSIAMSLAQLQHGEFHVEVDGDLFKAVLTLPEFRVRLEK